MKRRLTCETGSRCNYHEAEPRASCCFLCCHHDNHHVTCFFSQYSLMVMRAGNLRWLGLHSLKEVSSGKVSIKNNPQLCYTQPDKWTRLARSGAALTMMTNSPPAVCGEYACIRSSLLCDRDRIRTLVFPPTEQQNRTCDEECSEAGCWGPGPTMCVFCRHFSRRGRCAARCNLLQG